MLSLSLQEGESMFNKQILSALTIIIVSTNCDASITIKNATPNTIELYAVKGPSPLSSLTSRVESLFDTDATEATATSQKLLTLKNGASILIDHDTLIKWGMEAKYMQKTFDRITILIRNTGPSKSNYDVLRISKYTLRDLDKAIDGTITIHHNSSKKHNNYHLALSYKSSTDALSHFNEKNL